MLEFKEKCTIGIDLAASSRNPTGWATLKNKTVKTQLIYTNNEIIENTLQNHPELIAIDAPLSLQKKASFSEKQTKK